ncbi:ANTAR domain-containing response regulator [Streptomyces sp. NPDC004111]|uniref:ANTAR domain-containing response regulator n=1 Tax=Streptomyces sp. NPDC004111 TaxID=3364690 RepID=UPI0036BBB679
MEETHALRAAVPRPEKAEGPEAHLLSQLRREMAVHGEEPHVALVLPRPWKVVNATEPARALHYLQPETLPDDGPRGHKRSSKDDRAEQCGDLTRAALAGIPAHDVVLPGVADGRDLRVTALPLTGTADLVEPPGERQVLGALVHYRLHPEPLDPSAAQSLYGAAHTIGLHLRLRELAKENAQMREALVSRVVIEQAKGVLAERWHCTPDEAFIALRDHARSHQRKLADLCRHVIDGTETLRQLPTPQTPPTH